MLQKKIVLTTAVIFVTFVLRAVYSTMFAVAYVPPLSSLYLCNILRRYQQQDFARPCPDSTQRLCDAACYNVFSHIVGWMVLTPGAKPPPLPLTLFCNRRPVSFCPAEFQLIIVLISQPLALLVALWGMTSTRLHSRMQSKQGPVSLLMQ
jgi:hypothetical protein